MQVRKKLVKDQNSEHYQMTEKNIKICLDNQDRYQTPELNDALQLQYYGFSQISNLQKFININTLYLNNNVIEHIENLSCLKKLVTLNLSHNRIKAINNLQQLQQLTILDLSNNKLQKITGLSALKKLETLNISSNLISLAENISQINQNNKIYSLNLSNNPLNADNKIHQILRNLQNLKILYMKDTPFSRGIQNYRRQTICQLKALTFLDERPVTQNERLLAEAWKQGGILKQRQVKKLIQENKQQKNKKIYDEIMERNKKIEIKRDQLFEKLSQKQREQLQQCQKELKETQQCNQNWRKIEVLQKNIEQLQLYLKCFRQDVNDMSVGQLPQIPTNLIYDYDQHAIYVYGVNEEDLPKIKQVYFPEEIRPIIIRNFQKTKQSRWIPQYSTIFLEVKQYYQDKPQLILHQFNLRIHRFDAQYARKAKRFTISQLIQIMGGTAASITNEKENINLNQKQNNDLNELD